MQEGEVSGVVSDMYWTLLYFMGPFFSNPAKPMLQRLWCHTGYDIAYKHFKRDHTNPTNLAIHAVALIFQVTSNFAFLHRLDELIGSTRGMISMSTALMWSALLVPQKSAPLKARAAAVALIGAAYALRKKIAEKWEWYSWGQSILEAYQFKIAMRGFLPKEFRRKFFPFETSMVRFLVLRLGLQAFLTKFVERGILSTKGTASIALPILLFGSYKPFPRQLFRTTYWLNLINIFNSGYAGWIMALLTGEKAFYLHSAAFSASMLQGVAHYLGKQEGTLPQLNDAHYEFAHTTYFPVLALHRILEHLGARSALAASAAVKAAVAVKAGGA